VVTQPVSNGTPVPLAGRQLVAAAEFTRSPTTLTGRQLVAAAEFTRSHPGPNAAPTPIITIPTAEEGNAPPQLLSSRVLALVMLLLHMLV